MIVTRPDGKVVEIADADAQKAANAGYRKATDKEATDFIARHQPGTAAAEGALRGASLGLSDLALSFPLGGSESTAANTPEEMAARKAQNPIAAGAGEVAGSLATAGLTGGAGGAVAAKAGLGTVGKLAVAQGVQGGLWGMGSAVSEAALGDAELSGQRLAAGALSGGLTNAALGVGFHGLGAGVSALAKKAALPAVGDMLGKAADMSEKHALGIAKHPYADEILQKARDEGLVGLTASPAKVAEQAAAKRDLAGNAIGGLLANADQTSAPAVPEIRRLADGVLAKYRRLPTFDEAVARAEKLVSGFEQREGRMAPTTWSEVFKTQSDLLRSTEGHHTPETVKQVLKDLQVALRGYVEQGAEAALPAWRQGQFSKAIKDYAQYSALVDSAEGLAEKADSKLAGAVGYGGLGLVMGHPVAGVAMGLGKRALEPRAGFIAGAALRKLSDSGMLTKVADVFQNQVLDKAAVLPFAIRQRLTDAAARGSVDFLAEHTRLAQADPAYLKALGLTNETPQEVVNLGPRLAAVQAADATATDIGQRFDEAVARFFGGPGRPGRIADSKPTVKEFDAAQVAIQSILQNPEATFQTMPRDMTAHLPSVAGAAAATVVNAARFLQAKAPKDPNEGLPVGLRRPWEPSRAELSRWFKYVDAIEDPVSVIQRAKQGRVAPEHVEALQAVYPLLLDDVRARMIEALGTWKKPLPYAKRAGMSNFLGSTVLGVSPAQVAIIQQSHATVVPPPPEKPDGRQVVDAVKNMQTQAQRLEGR